MMARSYCLIIIRKAEMITASPVIIDAYIPPLRFLKTESYCDSYYQYHSSPAMTWAPDPF
jgi:hypothetical protein